ncbi:LuxR C-terminal-related transcriptional regulator [Paraburkholderia sp. RL18-103-BIB-C]|uniref:LuxR C-terminal-related transcriptional regulator n=1 Tax=unclassified Paraburkholderia TaxID=2615204 RepID=UPI0038B878B2
MHFKIDRALLINLFAGRSTPAALLNSCSMPRGETVRIPPDETSTGFTLYQTLTPREQELLPLLASGLLNKQAAAVRGITEYTVHLYRGHIMRKMQADSFATLVKLASKLQLKTPSTTIFGASR